MKKRLVCILLIVAVLVSAFAVTSFADESPSENEKEIYAFLTNELGLNTAAACGIMANIYHETGFRADLAVDTYYGLFMYYAPLVRELKTWCANNGQDYTTVAGQMAFFKVLLEGQIQYYNYDSMMASLRSLSNTAEGAYSAGDIFCRQFERPANASYQAKLRGSYASSKLFPKYYGTDVSGGTPTFTETPVSYTAVVTASSLNVRSGPSTRNSVTGSLSRGKSVNIVAETTDRTWCKLSAGGWVSKQYLSVDTPSTGFESVEASGTYYVDASALNVRSGAGSNYGIIDRLSDGVCVSIVAEATCSAGNVWCKLSTGGWVSKQYLVASAPSTGSESVEASGTYYVDASALNVRSGAGTNYSIIDRLSNGEKVSVTAEASGSGGYTWCQLESGGWVRKDYLSAEGADDANQYTVKASALNVRSGAGTNNSIVSSLRNGKKVSIIATALDAEGNTWGQIASGGWVSMEYLV